MDKRIVCTCGKACSSWDEFDAHQEERAAAGDTDSHSPEDW